MGARSVEMGCFGQRDMAGRQTKEWVKGGRQRRLQIDRRWFAVWPGTGPWSPENGALFKKKKNWFFGSLSGGCGPRCWRHVAPASFHHCCYWAGESMRWFLWATGLSPALFPVPQASLAFSLAVELPCFCAPSFSQLRHWKPSSWSLLGKGCLPIQWAPACMHAQACAVAPFACCSCGGYDYRTHTATPDASVVMVAVLYWRRSTPCDWFMELAAQAVKQSQGLCYV
jgi:hypothetical protein